VLLRVHALVGEGQRLRGVAVAVEPGEPVGGVDREPLAALGEGRLQPVAEPDEQRVARGMAEAAL
jgi:hypothetical protein